MATLTLADLAAEPTGATATIAGTDPAATNAVYCRRIDETHRAGGWLLKGSRTGDGAVSLSLDPALWWAYLLSAPPSGPPVVTPPAAVGVTTGLDSVATRCRAAVAARIALLDLPAVGSGNGRLEAPRAIKQHLVPDETDAPLPCLILTPHDARETIRSDTNATDLVGFPTRVLIVDKKGETQHGALPGVERWRHWVERAFDGQHLDGVPEASHCETEPDEVANTDLPIYQHLVSSLVVRVYCRVPFGLRV